jgi:hypothetical protein
MNLRELAAAPLLTALIAWGQGESLQRGLARELRRCLFADALRSFPAANYNAR